VGRSARFALQQRIARPLGLFQGIRLLDSVGIVRGEPQGYRLARGGRSGKGCEPVRLNIERIGEGRHDGFVERALPFRLGREVTLKVA
jgi:hypothetical protein